MRGVAPSILSADFARLAAQVEEVMAAGARVIHCDVMDGHFVPPITFGPMVVSALREALPDEAFLDVHLMIERPERHVVDFVKAGAGNVTFHVEATPHVDYTMNLIREAGAKAGVAINPGTAVEALAVKPDLALCMTVNPGWGGQPFIEALDRPHPRAAEARRARRRARGRRRHRRPDRRTVRASGRDDVRGGLGDLRHARSRRGLPGDLRRGGVWLAAPGGPACAGDNGAHAWPRHRPHRRRPPELPRHRAAAARERRLDGRRRGAGRHTGLREARALRPASCCSTSTCPTSTASTSPPG